MGLLVQGETLQGLGDRTFTPPEYVNTNPGSTLDGPRPASVFNMGPRQHDNIQLSNDHTCYAHTTFTDWNSNY